MGCFNSKGCFSHTPIVYGDKVVAFIGISEGKHARECDEFAPGMSFTPISLPIHGTYNDYGSVENIEHTASVKIIEKFFGKDIDTIFDEASHHELKFDTFLKDVEEKDHEFYSHGGYGDMIKGYETRYSFELVMEHEDVFYAMLKTNDIMDDMHEYFYHDKRSINILLAEDYDLDLKLKDTYHAVLDETTKKMKAALSDKKIVDGLSGESKEKANGLTEKEVEDVAISVARMELRKQGLLDRKVATFYPDNDDFLLAKKISFTQFGNEVNSSFYMYPFKDVMPDPELKKDSVEFISLMFALTRMCTTWGISNYCSQDAPYDETIEVLEATLKLMKEKQKIWNNQ